MILAANTGEVGTMGAALLDAGIKSAGVLVMAAVAAGCMRRQSAAARHMVWFLSVLGLLALPVLSWTLPGWNVLPQWTNPRPVVATPSVPAQQPTPVARQATDTSTPAERPKIVNSTEVSPANNPSVSAHVVQPPPVVAKTLPPPPATRRMAWKPLLMPLWMVGAAVAVSPTLLGLLSLWNLERRSRRETARTWTELLRHLMARVGLARPVELLKTGSRRMPMTWGVVRPKLLLPEEAEDWTEERRRVVMLHELAHAKRWDYLSNLLTQLVCAVYWFNPLVWIAARQMVKERERACDDIVLNNGSKPADYAEQVLQIAAGLPSAGSFAVYSGIAMARQSSLEERLRAILDKGRNRKALTRIAVLVMVAVFALVVGPLAMMRPAVSKAAATPQVKEVRIIAIGRPDNSRKVWWDTNGVAVNLGPVFDGRTPNAAFVVAIDRDGVQGMVDCSIVTVDKKIDGSGNGITGDMANGISTTICYLIDTPDGKARAYLDGGGQIDFTLKHGAGPWTETAVVYPGRTVVTNGGRFGLGKIEAIREATRTGLLWTSRMPGLMLIDGRYDFDSGYEIAWVAVDKQGKRTPIVDSTGGGQFVSSTNRHVFHHVQMGRADLDHFLVLSRPVKETVYRGIPTKVGMKSSIDPAKTKEREAVAKAEWGEAVEGVQTRAAFTGMRSNVPALLADLRNGGTVGVQVSENAFRWRVEVDGVWYRFNTNGAQLLTIVPGETRTNIAVVLDGNWMKAAPSEMNPAVFGSGGGGGIPRDFARDPLKFSPGKHTVRFGMMTRIVRLGAGAVLAVSKPVEVEVPQGGESAATNVPEPFKMPTDAVLQSWLSQSELVVVAKRKITRVVRDGKLVRLMKPFEGASGTMTSYWFAGDFEVIEVVKGDAIVGSNIVAFIDRRRDAPSIPGLEFDTGESVLLCLKANTQVKSTTQNSGGQTVDYSPGWALANREFGAQPANPELLKALRTQSNAGNDSAGGGDSSSVPDAKVLKALVDRADFVFAGRVVRIPYVFSAEGGFVSEHLTDFQVSSVFKGEVPESKAVRLMLKRPSKAGFLKDGEYLVVFLMRGNVTNNEAYGATFDMYNGIQSESPALLEALVTLTQTNASPTRMGPQVFIADIGPAEVVRAATGTEAVLANGGKLRLLALTNPKDSAAKWWKPDGTIIQPERDWVRFRQNWADQNLIAVFEAVHPNASPPNAPIGPAGDSWVIPMFFAGPVAEPGRVTAGFGAGTWRSIGRLKPGESIKREGFECTLESIKPLLPRVAGSTGPSGNCTIEASFTRLREVEVGLVAVGKQGERVVVAPTFNPTTDFPMTIDNWQVRQTIGTLDAPSVDYVEVFARPRGWASFTGIATRPGEPNQREPTRFELVINPIHLPLGMRTNSTVALPIAERAKLLSNLAQSELVIVGELTNGIGTAGTLSTTSFFCDLNVIEALKGDMAPGSTVHVAGKLAEGTDWKSILPGDELIMFLKKKDSTSGIGTTASPQWEIFDPIYGVQKANYRSVFGVKSLTLPPFPAADDASLLSNFARADVVIAGRATNCDGGFGGLSIMINYCNINVDEVIKGDVVPGSIIPTTIELAQGLASRTVRDGDDLVLFLRREIGDHKTGPLRMDSIRKFGVQTTTLELIAKLKAMARPQNGENAENRNGDTASFGPVMERDVPGFSYGNPRSLDLDTGKMVGTHPPGDLEFLAGESDSRVRHALDMVTVGVSSNKWDATAAEVLAALSGVAPQKQARLGGIESRRTYFFKTQEGAAGVLQVLPDENGAVKVRFKVIQNGPAKSAQAVPGGDDLLRKDRLFAEARRFSADSRDARDLRDPKDLEGEFSIPGVADTVSLKGRPMAVRISYANPWAETKQ